MIGTAWWLAVFVCSNVSGRCEQLDPGDNQPVMTAETCRQARQDFLKHSGMHPDKSGVWAEAMCRPVGQDDSPQPAPEKHL